MGARINIALVSDFFVKLLRLPMSFFDSKQTGDVLQRMGDHGRVQAFLTGQALTMAFSVVTLVVFSGVLLSYSGVLFAVFAAFSMVYVFWVTVFLKRRKTIDYCLFENIVYKHACFESDVLFMSAATLAVCGKSVAFCPADAIAYRFA